jgi:molecular chaperone IbpA
MKQVYTTLDIPSIYKFAIGFDDLFAQLQHLEQRGKDSGYPPFNLIKLNENNYAIELAVAGFAEDELDVEIENGELVIRGTNREVSLEAALNELEHNPVEYIHRGIAARDFVKRIKLAEGVEVNSAHVKNGILTVKLEQFIPEPVKQKVAISFEK